MTFPMENLFRPFWQQILVPHWGLATQNSIDLVVTAWKQYALDAAEVADPHLSGMCCSLYVKFTFSLNHFRELNFLQYLHM